MDISLLEKSKDKMKAVFLVKGVSTYHMNTIRRMMINKVPTMAIEDVEFRKNDSVLYDETIAHRLGLLPLKTDLRSYKLPAKCNCDGKGCAKCQLKMTLKAKGPGMVYASQIKSQDPKVKPIYPKTPIVKLAKGQSLELIAFAKLGIGKEHVKWSPCTAFYKHRPSIEITQSRVKDSKKIAKLCPANVFNVKAGKLAINKENYLKCTLCDACVDATNGGITVEREEGNFILTIECWGQLDYNKIVKEAVSVYDSTLDELDEAIEELK